MAGVADSVLAAPGRLIFIKVCEPGEDMSKRQVKHTWIVPPFWVSLSGFRHRRDVWVSQRCGETRMLCQAHIALLRKACPSWRCLCPARVEIRYRKGAKAEVLYSQPATSPSYPPQPTSCRSQTYTTNEMKVCPSPGSTSHTPTTQPPLQAEITFIYKTAIRSLICSLFVITCALNSLSPTAAIVVLGGTRPLSCAP